MPSLVNDVTPQIIGKIIRLIASPESFETMDDTLINRLCTSIFCDGDFHGRSFDSIEGDDDLISSVSSSLNSSSTIQKRISFKLALVIYLRSSHVVDCNTGSLREILKSTLRADDQLLSTFIEFTWHVLRKGSSVDYLGAFNTLLDPDLISNLFTILKNRANIHLRKMVLELLAAVVTYRVFCLHQDIRNTEMSEFLDEVHYATPVGVDILRAVGKQLGLLDIKAYPIVDLPHCATCDSLNASIAYANCIGLIRIHNTDDLYSKISPRLCGSIISIHLKQGGNPDGEFWSNILVSWERYLQIYLEENSVPLAELVPFALIGSQPICDHQIRLSISFMRKLSSELKHGIISSEPKTSPADRSIMWSLFRLLLHHNTDLYDQYLQDLVSTFYILSSLGDETQYQFSELQELLLTMRRICNFTCYVNSQLLLDILFPIRCLLKQDKDPLQKTILAHLVVDYLEDLFNKLPDKCDVIAQTALCSLSDLVEFFTSDSVHHEFVFQVENQVEVVCRLLKLINTKSTSSGLSPEMFAMFLSAVARLIDPQKPTLDYMRNAEFCQLCLTRLLEFAVLQYNSLAHIQAFEDVFHISRALLNVDYSEVLNPSMLLRSAHCFLNVSVGYFIASELCAMPLNHFLSAFSSVRLFPFIHQQDASHSNEFFDRLKALVSEKIIHDLGQHDMKLKMAYSNCPQCGENISELIEDILIACPGLALRDCSEG